MGLARAWAEYTDLHGPCKTDERTAYTTGTTRLESGRMKMSRFAPALVLVMCTGLPALASVVVPPSFEAMVADASEIFLGQVTERSSRWTQRGGKRLILTDVTFRTAAVLKGSPGTLRTLTFLGGSVGDAHLDVPGMPSFMVGDRDVLFVGNAGASFVPLVAMSHGRFRVALGRNGTGEVITNNARQPFVSVANYHSPARLRTTDAPMSLQDFLATIRRLTGTR